jgi:hypothetical protein|tara:strand:+ start:222 stop:518 length:297 start_codon:yes stop_codon:yes gene_type:complete
MGTPFKMNEWPGYQNPLKQKPVLSDRDRGLELLKLNAPEAITDNPNATPGGYTREVDENLRKATELLKKSGMSQEELERAGGSMGWNEFVDYHGLNIQ